MNEKKRGNREPRDLTQNHYRLRLLYENEQLKNQLD